LYFSICAFAREAFFLTAAADRMTMSIETNGKKKILVIEDDRDMNDLVCAVLSEAGYTTFSADSGETGIAIAEKDRPDLILLDVMLPKMDGIEVCRSLSSVESTKGIPVIMVTIKRELSTKLASYIAGARRYITKPFGIEELLEEVKRTLRQTHITRTLDIDVLDPRD